MFEGAKFFGSGRNPANDRPPEEQNQHHTGHHAHDLGQFIIESGGFLRFGPAPQALGNQAEQKQCGDAGGKTGEREVNGKKGSIQSRACIGHAHEPAQGGGRADGDQENHNPESPADLGGMDAPEGTQKDHKVDMVEHGQPPQR